MWDSLQQSHARECRKDYPKAVSRGSASVFRWSSSTSCYFHRNQKWGWRGYLAIICNFCVCTELSESFRLKGKEVLDGLEAVRSCWMCSMFVGAPAYHVVNCWNGAHWLCFDGLGVTFLTACGGCLSGKAVPTEEADA